MQNEIEKEVKSDTQKDMYLESGEKINEYKTQYYTRTEKIKAIESTAFIFCKYLKVWNLNP